MKQHIVFFISVVLSLVTAQSYGQGVNCLGATPLCSSFPSTFPAATSGTAPAGNSYGCLTNLSNPMWFSLTIGTPGNIVLTQTGTCNQDYVVWGPFNSLSAACSGLNAQPYNCNSGIGLSNSIAINSATAGQIYILLLQN